MWAETPMANYVPDPILAFTMMSSKKEARGVWLYQTVHGAAPSLPHCIGKPVGHQSVQLNQALKYVTLTKLHMLFPLLDHPEPLHWLVLCPPLCESCNLL